MQKIEIKIPEQYHISKSIIYDIQMLNTDITITNKKNNIIVIEESKYKFDDYEYIKFVFPDNFISNNNFDILYNINYEELNFEQVNNTIYIKMGIFDIIGLITAIIISSLVVWAKKGKKGRVRSENAEYDLKDPKTGKSQKRMADISFISYEKASEEEQDKWIKGRIPIAPTLSIEVVSSKYGLKPALLKMKLVWMFFGTDIGLVICPFSKKIYFFEKGKIGYKTQSIYKTFTHKLLPDYIGDYSEYVDEI